MKPRPRIDAVFIEPPKVKKLEKQCKNCLGPMPVNAKGNYCSSRCLAIKYGVY